MGHLSPFTRACCKSFQFTLYHISFSGFFTSFTKITNIPFITLFWCLNELLNWSGMTLSKFVTTDEVMPLNLSYFNTFINSVKKTRRDMEKNTVFNKWVEYDSMNQRITCQLESNWNWQDYFSCLNFAVYNAQYWIKLQPLFINLVY